MHETIKAFHMEGEMADSNIVKIKEHFVHVLESRMRDSDHVPVLDLEPQFTLDYSAEREVYDFRLTIYGVRVEGAAWHIAGVMNGKRIQRSIQNDK